MVKYYLLLTYAFIIAGVPSGYGQSKLIFTGTYNGKFHPLDSIIIENATTGTKIVKYYPDTLLKLLITGIDELPDSKSISLSKNYPNPFQDNTHINIYIPEDDKISITIFNLAGKQILNYGKTLPAGTHSFTFTGSKEKVYLLSLKCSGFSSAIKMVNTGRINNHEENLEYNGNIVDNISQIKGKSEFEYNTGDDLVLTGYMTDVAGTLFSDTITDSPAESTTYTFSFKNKNRLVILMYHEITDSVPENEYERNSVDFENDLIYLRDNNFQVLSINDLLLLQSGELALISDAVIITFDDGYESNYSKAFPILSEYKMAATFFLTTEWIETPDYMTWSEVWLMSEYLDTEGKRPFNMGSHTSSHPYLERSVQYFPLHEDYLNFLHTELADSKTWIADVTGQTDIFLSLPYGDGANNEDIIAIAKETGYNGIRTSVWDSFTVQEMNPFALPSIPVLSDTSIEIIDDYLKY